MSRRQELPVVALLVALMAVGILGGTGYAWSRWNVQIATATDVEPVGLPTDRDVQPSGVPESAPQAPTPEAPAYQAPTFDELTPTQGRSRPVLLLVGDGWAAGKGASSVDTSYAALLARDLGWEIRTAAEPGAGFTVPGQDGSTIPDLYAAAPLRDIRPDVVLVQGGYAGATDIAAVTRAIAELGERVTADLPGVPLVAVSAFRPPGVHARWEAAMTAAWRAVEGALVLRPTEHGWSDVPTGPARNPLDVGHGIIAAAIVQSLREAGLVTQGLTFG